MHPKPFCSHIDVDSRHVSEGSDLVVADGAGNRPWPDVGDRRTRRIALAPYRLPPLPAIERLGGSVRVRVQRQLWCQLTGGLTEQQC